MMLLIHNPEYWVKEYLKPLSASALFTLLLPSVTSFYLVSSRVRDGGKTVCFYTAVPLSVGLSVKIQELKLSITSLKFVFLPIFQRPLVFAPLEK